MLPILATAIQNLELSSDPPPIDLPIVLEATEDSPAALKASEVLIQSEVLIKSYELLKECHPAAPSTAQMANTFAKDREETMRAFQAARKLMLNQLKVKLASKMGEVAEPFVLTDDEHHLARRIIHRGKDREQSPRKTFGPGIGALLYDFEKVMAKMQNLV